MKFRDKRAVTLALICLVSSRAFAECTIADDAKLLDPIEVGFCESDAVFVGKSEGGVESIGGYTEEGSATKHFRIQRSTVRVLKRFKGDTADKVTMVADLYAKDSAYVFESGKTYLIFAKRRAAENEYVGASAACSVQPTLRSDEAAKAIKQLEQHATGVKKINCEAIRKKN